jgi:hypothetical protein
MDEDVLATFVRLDEAKALGAVEPLDGSGIHIDSHSVRSKTRHIVRLAQIFGERSRASPGSIQNRA